MLHGCSLSRPFILWSKKKILTCSKVSQTKSLLLKVKCSLIFQSITYFLFDYWFYLDEALKLLTWTYACLNLQYNCNLKNMALYAANAYYYCFKFVVPTFSLFCTNNKQVLLNIVVWRCEILSSFAWPPFLPLSHPLFYLE